MYCIDMNDRIKVAFLDYSPHYAGAERAMVSLISGLRDTDYNGCIIAPYPLPHHSRFKEFGVELHYLNVRKKWWMGSDYWKSPIRGSDFIKRLLFGMQLSIFLRKKVISILHVNLLRPDCGMLLLFPRLASVKILGHYRSISQSWTPPRLVRALCHQIICVSKVVQDNLVKVRGHEKSRVVYDPVATHLSTTETKEESKIRWGCNANRFLFASVAYLSPHKGHDNAIHAFCKFAEDYPDCELLIAGGGPDAELQRLKNIASEYPQFSSRIHFTEEQVSDVASVYNAADVVLSLTKNGEAFGLVPYEAAMLGTPCIAPRRGAIMEIVEDEKHAFLVETESVEDIASCMCKLMREYQQKKNVTQVLKQLVNERLSRVAHVQAVVRVYDNLLKR